ncbi:phosphatases II, partial [Neoconidiobolus thromboides FSU 785]
PIEIIPGLYLGTQHDANNTKHLIKLGIDSILNVAEEVDSKPNSPFDGNEKIMSYFDTAFEFIDQARINRKKKVLVHCQLGVSRSATLIIAYLMYKINYTCHEAYNFVKSKSCKVAPNLHLFTQLIQYE